jgi:hypothetical protein
MTQPVVTVTVLAAWLPGQDPKVEKGPQAATDSLAALVSHWTSLSLGFLFCKRETMK